MAAHHKSGQQLIFHWIHIILYDAQHVKPGQNRLRQLHVLLERNRWVVSPPDRICCSNNRTSCLETCHNTSFRDGYRLLFHRLVNRRPICVVHLVELVDQAGALVSKDKRAAFQCPFTCDGVLAKTGRQTDGGGTLTCSKDGSVCSLLNIFEELRFHSSRVAEKEYVDISANAEFVVDIFRNAAEERESDGSLDVLVAIDRGSDGLDDTLANTFIPGEISHFPFILFR